MQVIDRFIFVSFRAGGGVTRSASDIKDMLLKWSRAKTKEYEVSFDSIFRLIKNYLRIETQFFN